MSAQERRQLAHDARVAVGRLAVALTEDRKGTRSDVDRLTGVYAMCARFESEAAAEVPS